MICAVEPTAPEPGEIPACSVFHCSEKIGNIVIGNQELFLKHPELFDVVSENEKLTQAQKDKIKENTEKIQTLMVLSIRFLSASA